MSATVTSTLSPHVATITPFPTGGMMGHEDDARSRREQARAAALRRLDAGEWLRPGELGALLGGDRFSAAYWLTRGVKIGADRFHIRYRRTPGGHRECHPDDVRQVLDAYQREHRGNAEGTGRQG